jgi:hypothetical protein
MTFNKKAFNRLQKQDVDMQVDLDDDITYLVTSMSLVSFQMSTRNMFELDVVLYILGLTKTNFNFSYDRS